MSNILTLILFGMGLIAANQALSIWTREKVNTFYNTYMFWLCFFTAMWLWGFCGLCFYSGDNLNVCSALRMFVLTGIAGSTLMCIMIYATWTNLSDLFVHRIGRGIFIINSLAWVVAQLPGSVTFHRMEIGWSYSHNPFWGRTVYNICMGIDLLMMLGICLRGPKNLKYKRQRIRILCGLWCTIICAIGLTGDVILPLLNPSFNVIPTSSIAMFIICFTIYHGSLQFKFNTITLQSISRELFYRVDLPIIALDADGKIELVNDSAERFFETTQKQIHHHDVVELFYADMEGRAEKIALWEKMEYIKMDVHIRNNEKICQCIINQVNDRYDEKLGYILTLYDLTDRISMIKELELSKKKAVEANLTKSAFLANVSHEIRTPLNVILGMSELLTRGGFSEEEAKEQLKSIHAAGTNLLEIINNILDMSKIESGKFEINAVEYDLKGMVDNISKTMRVSTESKNLEFECILNEKLPGRLIGDDIRIKQILTNLLGNAIKFTEKGKITLHVDGAIQEKDKLVRLLIKVSDTGIGIKEEDIKRLFGLFAQVDTKKNRNKTGSGLGLAISKQLAELMGGTIRIESEYGKGSTFIVEIEQNYTSLKSVSEMADETTQKVEFDYKNVKKMQDAHVLVVDDNFTNLKVMEGMLRPYDMQVDTADSGAKAIEAVCNKEYDLIFMDHMMPEMDGVETLANIRALDGDYYKKVPIVALTANSMVGIREFFLSKGFQEFMDKPINSAKLDKLLRVYLLQEDISIPLPAKSQAMYKATSGYEMKHVNVESVMYQYQGDMDLYVEILKVFLKDLEEKIAILPDLWEQKEYEEFATHIHGIKSAAKNIGADDFGTLCERIEMNAKSQKYATIERNLNQFYSLANQVKVDVAKYLNSMVKKNTSIREYREQPEQSLLENMLKTAENTDILALKEQLQELKSKQYGIKEEKYVYQLETAVDGLEYDVVVHILKKWLSEML